MIQVSYDEAHNVVILEFSGKIDTAQAEQSYLDIQKAIPTHGKGFKVLTDLSRLESADPKILDAIKRSMDYFNEHGVTQVLRVIPHLDQDIGFNILSFFHYSKNVVCLTLPSRQEAEARLKMSFQNGNS